MKVVNLTPHPLNLKLSDGTFIEIPSEGEIRVGQITKEVGTISTEKGEIKLIKKELTDIAPEDLEKVKQILQKPDTVVVVSLLTAQKLVQLLPEYRNRILIVGNTIRDENGRIIGADALALL